MNKLAVRLIFLEFEAQGWFALKVKHIYTTYHDHYQDTFKSQFYKIARHKSPAVGEHWSVGLTWQFSNIVL